MDAKLEELVSSAIATACNVDEAAISLETRLCDLGVDSISVVAIVAQVGAEHGLELSSDQLIELFDALIVRDFILLLQRAILEQATQ